MSTDNPPPPPAPPPMPPPGFPVWDASDLPGVVAEHTRKAALEVTRKFIERVDIKALDEMRKTLELPPETLGVLVEIHAKKLAELDRPPPNLLTQSRIGREVLPFSIGVSILPGQSAEIKARPQRMAFRPERVFISGADPAYKAPWWKRMWPWYSKPEHNGAADWLVNDIKIGGRSQFSQAGDIPGDMFGTTAIDSFVSFETAQLGMDVVIVVTYIGACPKGHRFYGAMIGTGDF